MEELGGASNAHVKDDHRKESDVEIMSIYLKSVNGAPWPENFTEDVDVFNKNPNEEVFDSENPIFVIVKPGTEACGRTDGCDSGCWRIMAGDKLIKNEDTGKFLGFKKILKFCGKTTKARGYKRSWVMEEYRLRMSKWNPKQEEDHVLCKIQLLFQTEIGFLLSKQLSYLSSDTLLKTQSLPAYGVCLTNAQDDGAYYLKRILDSGGGNKWPDYVTNDVYSVHPSTLVDHEDERFVDSGLCIFANRTDACGYTDGGCESGCWRIVEDDKPIYSMSHDEVMGYKRVFTFYEVDRDKYFDVVKGRDEVFKNWTMDEYRLAEEEMKDKVLCVIECVIELRRY